MDNISFKEYLNEINLNRVIKHLKDPNEAVVIFTTWRAENPKEYNEASLRAAASKLRAAGFGYVYVEGHWIENKGTEDERDVSEMSIFAIARKERAKELIALCKKIADENNQDAIFVKDGDGKNNRYYLLYKDGHEEILSGNITLNIKDFYTKLLRKNRAFTIEGVKTYELKSYWGLYAMARQNRDENGDAEVVQE